MKSNRSTSVLMPSTIVATVTLVAIALAQTASTSVTPSKIRDLSWLSGRWSGPMFGQPSEEHWLKPQGRSVLGVYRLGPESTKPVFEIMLIEEEEQGVMLRLRHFGSKLVPWEKEEPVTLRMTRQAEKEVEFEGVGQTDLKRLTYRRDPEDRLQINMVFERNGKPSTETATLKRIAGDS